MNQAPGVFRAVIDGCAALAGQPRRDHRARASTPALLGPLPPSVRHRASSCRRPPCCRLRRAVVSHAGAGTMLGALCHGLPQLCLPQGTDQPFNTAALLPTGAALALQPDEITADAVAEALGRLLGEPSYRAAAPAARRDRADADRGRRCWRTSWTPPALPAEPRLQRQAVPL